MGKLSEYILTPGEILRDEFLVPMGMSIGELARKMERSESFVSDIVDGRQEMTLEIAAMLGQAFGTSPAVADFLNIFLYIRYF